MITSRHLKVVLLTVLVGTTFFLASFNATIRFLVDQHQRTDGASASASSSATASQHDDDDDDVDGGTIANAAAVAGEEGDGNVVADQVVNELQQQQQQRRRQKQNSFKTTTRPLDGFAQDAYFIDPETRTKKKYLQRRPPTAAATTTTDFNDNNNKVSTADAHYAKAMRMLSSPFDQLKDGGNALPHAIYWGEFDQGGVGVTDSAAAAATGSDGAGSDGAGGNNRGDKFVKMDDYYYRYSGKLGDKVDYGNELVSRKDRSQRQRRKKMQSRMRQRERRRRTDDRAASATTGGDDDDDDDELALILEEFKDFMLEFFESISDWIHDTLSFISTIDTPDSTDDYDDENDANDDEYHYYYYYHHQDHRHHLGVGVVVDDARDGNNLFSWRDTTVGKQLRWTYSKVVSLWYHRQRREESYDATATASFDFTATMGKNTKATASSSSSSSSSSTLSRQDLMAWEGLFHLEKAAELGHAEAQRIVANSLASGILPISDHSLMHRVAEWKYHRRRRRLDNRNSNNDNDDDDDDRVQKLIMTNWTSILLQSTLHVPDDFSSAGVGASTGGEQLSRAIILWHLSAMAGNVESAMALGYRHLYSATGGLTQTFIARPSHYHSQILDDDTAISIGFHPVHGGVIGGQHSRADGGGGGGGGGGITNAGGSADSHYGVLGTCHSALAYYEAAAHGVMDELESGPTKGKLTLPIEDHRLLEIFNTGGASSALSRYNKYDESAEALQYYHLLAIGSRSHDPDISAAHILASYYYRGLRGVKQDLRKALQYLEICAEYHDKECAGQAGLMHVWGIGMTPEERDLSKAYDYFILGTTGKLDYCIEQWRRRKKQNNNNAGLEGEVELCDKHSVTGLGLLNLFGVDGLIDRDVNMARRWFEHGKDIEDSESMYNYAMLHLGWMVSELDDLPTNITAVNSAHDKHAGSSDQHTSVFDQNYMTHRKAPAEPNDGDRYTGPSVSDYNIAIQQLRAAAKNGHLQAKHKLGMLYASGATVPRKNGRPTIVVQQSCPSALRYFKSVAENGHTFSRRNRAAWKQYMAGDYESSLRNYLASAETGSEVGQVNAAFLLEQGVCLGMTATACTHASVRLWRAAARQGNLEACLRVGDFYYYGRMMKSRGQFKRDFASGEPATVYDREEYLSLVTSKTFYFVPGPYRWMRYVLYPEELFHLTNEWLSLSLRNLWQHTMSVIFHDQPGDNQKTSLLTSQNACSDETGGICLPNWVSNNGDDDAIDGKAEKHDHMVIAAQYYRKAAEDYKSALAHFNLGFMHEWGLGLAQDFPLAKRHYDLAGENNANLAPSIALYAMNIHQKAVKIVMYLKEYGLRS